MPELFSMSAATAGLATTTLHASRLVYTDVKAITHAPVVIKQLELDIATLNDNLETVNAINRLEWEKLGPVICEKSSTILASCNKTCEQFRADLAPWTQHSRDGDLSKRDRFQIGFYKQKEIESFGRQLQSCKMSLTGAVTLASLHRSMLNGAANDDVAAMLAADRENRATVDKRIQEQIEAISKQLEQLVLGDRPRPNEAESGDLETALSQIKAERASLEACKALVKELGSRLDQESKVISKGVAPSQNNYFGSHSSGAQVGHNTGGITVHHGSRTRPEAST